MPGVEHVSSFALYRELGVVPASRIEDTKDQPVKSFSSGFSVITGPVA